MASTFSPVRRRLTALRLSALGIDDPTARSPQDAVGAALATQAQDYAGALWSVALRSPAATPADIEAAHGSGAFVRSSSPCSR